MNTEKKLSALLHELQHARSPLAQARVLARAWRTVRELSPTDRRLLARHAGFDGAEEILEGISRRKGGLVPAMLLRTLANARATDEKAVSELLAAYREPQRRQEAITMGADLARDLFSDPAEEKAEHEVGKALGELQAVEEALAESTAEALAALNSLDPEAATQAGAEPGRPTESIPVSEAESPVLEAAPNPDVESDPQAEVDAEPFPVPEQTLQPPPSPPPPIVDWDLWRAAAGDSHEDATPDAQVRTSVVEPGSRRFEARAIMEAMGAAPSLISQLRVLRREVAGFRGSSVATFRELIESFPDGWARRRALCALFDAGMPTEPLEALELVSCLDRELDRRWCLGALARRHGLRGVALDRALELLHSDYSRRRLTAMVGPGAATTHPRSTS